MCLFTKSHVANDAAAKLATKLGDTKVKQSACQLRQLAQVYLSGSLPPTLAGLSHKLSPIVINKLKRIEKVKLHYNEKNQIIHSGKVSNYFMHPTILLSNALDISAIIHPI